MSSLKNIVKIAESFVGKHPEIYVKFDNGHEINSHSLSVIDENVAFRNYSIIIIRIRCWSENGSFEFVARNEVFMPSVIYQINGEYSSVISHEHQLMSELKAIEVIVLSKISMYIKNIRHLISVLLVLLATFVLIRIFRFIFGWISEPIAYTIMLISLFGVIITRKLVPPIEFRFYQGEKSFLIRYNVIKFLTVVLMCSFIVGLVVNYTSDRLKGLVF
jgi:hypothetical protein